MESFVEELQQLKEQNQYRILRNFTNKQGFYAECNGESFVNLSSNDYLGLAFHKTIQEDFYGEMNAENMMNQFGLGSSSSRLLTGNSSLYLELENLLAVEYGKEACLLFNSGYHANIGILPSVMRKGDAIFSDKLNHASIIDGIKLSDADSIRYKHLDYEHLETILEKNRGKYKRAIIVTESIFSMDGDVADLKRLVDLKNKYDCLLYVDEAHAVGTRGSKGLGIGEEQACLSDIDFFVGTFGKAFASQGAFLLCTGIMKEYLVNKSRSLIFTTALPPINLYWTMFVFKRILGMQAERTHLQELSGKLKKSLDVIGYPSISNSNIIPIMLFENKKAELCAKEMQNNGLLVFPVRPPTVPKNTARLRLSLSANLTWKELEMIPHLLMGIDFNNNVC